MERDTDSHLLKYVQCQTARRRCEPGKLWATWSYAHRTSPAFTSGLHTCAGNSSYLYDSTPGFPNGATTNYLRASLQTSESLRSRFRGSNFLADVAFSNNTLASITCTRVGYALQSSVDCLMKLKLFHEVHNLRKRNAGI